MKSWKMCPALRKRRNIPHKPCGEVVFATAVLKVNSEEQMHLNASHYTL